MKIFTIALLSLLVLVSGCSTAEKIPTIDELQTYTGGSYIKSVISLSLTSTSNVTIVKDKTELENLKTDCGKYFKLQPHYKIKITGANPFYRSSYEIFIDAVDKKVDCSKFYQDGKLNFLRSSSSVEDLSRTSEEFFTGIGILPENFFKDLPEGANIITWWDLGQYITHLSQAKSVLNYVNQEGNMSVAEITSGKTFPREDDPKFEDKQKVSDISKFFVTSSENEALCIAKKYGATHTIVSVDLVGKVYWLNRFALEDKYKGQLDSVATYTAIILDADSETETEEVLKSKDPSLPLFVRFNKTNNHLESYFVNGEQILNIPNIYYDEVLLAKIDDKVSNFNGTLILNKDLRSAIFVEERLQKSIFTRLFFMDKLALENFKLVKNWDGRIKLFKINYPENLVCN